MKFILSLIQSISARFIGNNRNYLNAPEDILSWVRVDHIWKLWHVVPSLILTIIIVVKILPAISKGYAKALQENGIVIPIAAILILIPVLVLNGIIIERILIRTNAQYKKFIDSSNA